MDNNLEATLKEFKKNYLLKVADNIGFFTSLADNPEETDVEILYDKVHKISGTGGMYGFKNLSDEATDFEFYLQKIKNSDSKINETELKNRLIKFIVNIKKIIKEGV